MEAEFERLVGIFDAANQLVDKAGLELDEATTTSEETYERYQESNRAVGRREVKCAAAQRKYDEAQAENSRSKRIARKAEEDMNRLTQAKDKALTEAEEARQRVLAFRQKHKKR